MDPVLPWSTWSRVLPNNHRPEYHPTGQPLIRRPLYDPREEEASIADGRANALALCVLEGLGVRRQGVGALSALEASDP